MAGRYPNPRRKNRQKRRPGHKRPARKAPARKAMIRARRPLVELKKNTFVNHTYQAITEDITVLVPDSWMLMTQGFSDNQMVGNNLLSRFINHKMFLSFSNSNSIPHNANIRVIQGWYKLPPNDVPQTETIPGGTRKGLYAYNPANVIKSELTNMLDNPLGTIDRSVFSVKADYMLKGVPTATYDNTGTPTFVREGRLLRCSWKPNKKINYVPASTGTSGAFTHLSPANQIKQWIPFFAMYFGNNASFTTGNKPTYILENSHYYTDS